MLDTVILRFEEGGRPLPRHRLAFPQRQYEGQFTFKEAVCAPFRRTVLVARLAGPNGVDVLPPLYDARLVYFEDGEASVTGLELDTLNRKFSAQAWHVRLASVKT